MSTLARIAPHAGRKTQRVSLLSLLHAFGHEPSGGQRNFWLRRAHELEWIFRDCWQNYREQAKRAHPDTGGSHEASALLNAKWTELERRFRQRCRGLAIPQIAPPMEPRARLRKEAEFHHDMNQVRSAATKLRITTGAIRERIRSGWPLEKALTAPLQPRGKRACHARKGSR